MSDLPTNDPRVAHDSKLDSTFGSLKLLREVALHCTRCDLHQTRSQVVFGVGAENGVMIVGEGPGEEDDAKGQPFVGRSGRLLDSLLRQSGMPRQSVWLTNVVKSRPVTLENGYPRNRVPTASEIKACEIWWQNEIKLVKPKIVVCLGATAAKTITGNKGFQISKERGVWLPGPQDTEVFVTFHPAYILRLREPQLSEVKKIVLEDLAVVKQRYEALTNGTAEPHPWQRPPESQQLSLF